MPPSTSCVVLAPWAASSLFLYAVLGEGPDAVSVFLAFVGNCSPPHSVVLALWSEVVWPCVPGSVSGLSVLVHWFTFCLFARTTLFWLLWLCNKF